MTLVLAIKDVLNVKTNFFVVLFCHKNKTSYCRLHKEWTAVGVSASRTITHRHTVVSYFSVQESK